MDSFVFESDDFLMLRAEHGSDLVESLTEFAKENGIEAAAFTAMGALKSAKLGFYDQDSHEYQGMKIDHPCEIASCTGNISLKDGEPFVHAHAILADEEGETKGGHLSEAEVFAAEIHLQKLEGPKLSRKHDEVTDLSLWEKE